MTGPDEAAVAADGAGPLATRLSPRVAACLAYAAWWVTGAIVLALEPRHPFVRFHARQAVVGFGLLWLAGVFLWAASFASAFLSPVLFRATAVIANLVWVVALGAWVACLVAAARGRQWALPGLSRLAPRWLGPAGDGAARQAAR